MGNLFSLLGRQNSSSSNSRSQSSNRSNGTPHLGRRSSSSHSKAFSFLKSAKGMGMSTSSAAGEKSLAKKKYAFIPDLFTSLSQVTEALRKEGLESSNLILGIDFTKSNEWTGKKSFKNQSLHAIGDTPNPYEKAISIIGKTLAPFDEDNLIPCFGFGDATTHDQEVFSFHSDHSPCHGFEEVLSCYRKIVPNLRLSGPTSYAPVVEAAIDIVEKNNGQYHVLVIIADGQVTRSIDTSDNELSPQEKETIRSIVEASSHPLSIILVGVGDGPWEDMRKFDDKLPAREFDNFQFVNFTNIMSSNTSPAEKETAFALAALMEVPFQYKAAFEFGILGRVTGKAKKVVPRPPPGPYSRPTLPREPSNLPSDSGDERNQMACPICLTNGKDLAFDCGHMTCRDCGSRVAQCPICRKPINHRLRVYTG
ncbi:E3 ubiquitin-protein ligase RGLG4 [Humulus lupulus]|uniref:E3 ubiquitin-protein ligase RGLG4 n=1 Tax=Humulus lupulus TaxID=3486 RepID=UPI002B402494|nr:E3 ubiquitin-protein ligase RGLG4 [Humulus lupulus]